MGGNSNDTLHLDFRRFSLAQLSPAQRSGYPHKLSYYGGLGGCSWWCRRHLTGSTYLQYSTVQYSAVQYNHSTPTGHCAALSAVGELTNKFVLGYHHSIFLF